MVRKYIRKTERQSWNSVSMAKAIIEADEKGIGTETLAKTYGVLEATLRRRIKTYKQHRDIELAVSKGLGRFTPTFTQEQKRTLLDYLLVMESRLHGLTCKNLCTLAFDLAQKNGIPHNFQNRKAGKDWRLNFMQRNKEVSLRKPQSTSQARAQAFTKEAVSGFHKLIEGAIKKFHLTPDRIYNVDECGVTPVPKHQSKILAMRGKNQVGVLAAGERGQLVTLELCISADGRYMPPFFVFLESSHKFYDNMLLDAPQGSEIEFSSNGWMVREIFFNWFKEFVDFSGASLENPVVLVLDGATVHTENLEAMDYGFEHGVDVITLPPHTTHRLQPLDVACMRPFSVAYSDAIKEWHRDNVGRVVTVQEIPKLVNKAFERAATSSSAKTGFRKTGIWLLNKNIFPDDMYVASTPCANPQTAPSQNGSVNDHSETSNSSDAENSSIDSSGESGTEDDNFQPAPSPLNASSSSSDAEDSSSDSSGESGAEDDNFQAVSSPLNASSSSSVAEDSSFDSPRESDAEDNIRSRKKTRIPAGGISSESIPGCSTWLDDLTHSNRRNDTPTSARRSRERFNGGPAKKKRRILRCCDESSDDGSVETLTRLKSYNLHTSVDNSTSGPFDSCNSDSSSRADGEIPSAVDSEVTERLSQTLRQLSVHNPSTDCDSEAEEFHGFDESTIRNAIDEAQYGLRRLREGYAERENEVEGEHTRVEKRLWCSDDSNEENEEERARPEKRNCRSGQHIPNPRRKSNQPFMITPAQLLPLRQAPPKKTRKPRARGQSRILTASPYRKQLAEKQLRKSAPKRLAINARRARGASRGGRICPRETRKKSYEPPDHNHNPNHICLFCGKRSDDSLESWAQCKSCNEWAHDLCAAYDDNSEEVGYQCDYCCIIKEFLS